MRIGGVVVECAYIGQTRNLKRRDRQHRGLAPQRDGVVKEQPWADQIVRLRTVRTGVWTDAELNVAELAEICSRLPVLNARDNPNPNRIPIYTQHEQRKARDPNWVIPDWSRPSRPVLPCPVPSRDVQRPSWVRLGTARLGRWAGRKARAAARRTAPWVAVWVVLCVAGLVWAPMPDGQVPGAAVVATGGLVVLWTQRKNKTTRRRGRRAARRRTR